MEISPLEPRYWIQETIPDDEGSWFVGFAFFINGQVYGNTTFYGPTGSELIAIAAKAQAETFDAKAKQTILRKLSEQMK